MKRTIPLITLSILLAACTPSQGQQAAQGGNGYPARVVLPTQPLAAEQPPRQPENAKWQSAGERAIGFGAPLGTMLLTIACERDAAGAGWLRITRRTRAPSGARALFALEGAKHVARLPVNVIRAGEDGEWQGLVLARAAKLDVLSDGTAIEATLPGGGTLMLPADPEPGRLLQACRS